MRVDGHVWAVDLPEVLVVSRDDGVFSGLTSNGDRRFSTRIVGPVQGFFQLAARCQACLIVRVYRFTHIGGLFDFRIIASVVTFNFILTYLGDIPLQLVNRTRTTATWRQRISLCKHAIELLSYVPHSSGPLYRCRRLDGCIGRDGVGTPASAPVPTCIAGGQRLRLPDRRRQSRTPVA